MRDETLAQSVVLLSIIAAGLIGVSAYRAGVRDGELAPIVMRGGLGAGADCQAGHICYDAGYGGSDYSCPIIIRCEEKK